MLKRLGRLRFGTKAVRSESIVGRRLEAIYAGELPGPIGSVGYRLPDRSTAMIISKRFAALEWANRNWLVASPDTDYGAFFNTIEIDKGKVGNVVIVGKGSRPPKRVHFQGNNGVAIFGENTPWQVDIDLRLSSDDEIFFWGAGSTSNGSSIILSGPRMSVIVGEDAMFAAGTIVRTSDLHSIISTIGGDWINKPSPILIEPHVWVGQEAMILKGARLGAGAVVGAKSLVTGNIPRNTIAAGAPAKVIKVDIAWDRATEPLPDALERAMALGVKTA